jgi:hypothetical protein
MEVVSVRQKRPDSQLLQGRQFVADPKALYGGHRRHKGRNGGDIGGAPWGGQFRRRRIAKVV